MGKSKGRLRRVDLSGLAERITREDSAEAVAVVVGLLGGRAGCVR
ncbi:MAG: hypothetical protein ABIQ18_28005 [Umezawaea sp.]